MASNFSHEILSILLIFVLLLSYSLAVKVDGGSDKNSDVNDFAEFETEDDDEGDDAYEDDVENLKPPERNRADEFSDDDDDVDVETGKFDLQIESALYYFDPNFLY